MLAEAEFVRHLNKLTPAGGAVKGRGGNRSLPDVVVGDG